MKGLGIGRGGRGGKGKTWWRDGKGREGAEGRERVGKGEGGLDFDICLGAPEFLVTPLVQRYSDDHYRTIDQTTRKLLHRIAGCQRPHSLASVVHRASETIEFHSAGQPLDLVQCSGRPMHTVTVTQFQCQLAFAAILWVKLLQMFFTVISLKFALSAS